MGGLFVGQGHASAAFNYTDHLMDDPVMRSNKTMTAQEVQDFLTNQGSGLAVFTDIEDCGSTSGAHYSFYATYYHCGARMSAAQIIYDSAQAYGINPQVILATLQKEQSLITTPNPTSSQLNYAMGYGCPDSGGCSYPGFFNQVDNGTWQFRVDMELASGNNYWGYAPSSYPCNGATRYYSAALKAGNDVTFYDDYGTGYTHFVIPNYSTGTLYCYTPHVYPGSSQEYYSGSKNFVYYFNRWFVPYSWRVNSQYAYTDSSKTTPVNLANLHPGDKVYVGFTALNTGNVTWTNNGPNPIMVGTNGPQERTSIFSNGSSWLSPTRPALMKEASVDPGSVGTFEFWITVPTTPTSGGTYFERFNLLANNATWFNDVGLGFYIQFPQPTYTWKISSQYAYTDSNKTTQVNMANLHPGDKVYVGFTAQNTGNVTWSNTGSNAVMVGTANTLDRISIFAPGSGWLSSSRPALLKEVSVAPGGTGTFEYWMTVPVNPTTGGVYNERFNLIANNLTWFGDTGLSYYVNFPKPSYTWQLMSQYAYTDGSKTTPVNMANLHPGDKVWVGFTAKNTGNVTWTNNGSNPIMVGTLNPMERQSLFSPGSSWLSGTRPTLLKESSVAPGSTGTFEYWMTAPSTLGIYNERFGLIANGLIWLNDTGLSYYAKVN
jgi:hypothetical protein